mgnify:CR=1 FL=1
MPEPNDTYAILKCNKEQRCTKTAEGNTYLCVCIFFLVSYRLAPNFIGCITRDSLFSDHGRLPVWNETLEFNLEQEDMSKELAVQVFGVNHEKEELLGVAK